MNKPSKALSVPHLLILTTAAARPDHMIMPLPSATTLMAKRAKTLSVAQLLILSTAAQRPDRMVMPLPSTLRARGASQHNLLASLIKLALVEEVPTDILVLGWRKDELGQHYALRLTATGMAAVGGKEGGAAPEAAPPQLSVIEAIIKVPAEVPATANIEPLTTTGTATPGGKLGQILAAVGAPAGATITELASMTGWLPHTARAALTRLKQRGFPIQLVKQTDRKAYHLIQAGA